MKKLRCTHFCTFRPLFMNFRGLVKIFSKFRGHLLSSGYHKNSGRVETLVWAMEYLDFRVEGAGQPPLTPLNPEKCSPLFALFSYPPGGLRGLNFVASKSTILEKAQNSSTKMVPFENFSFSPLEPPKSNPFSTSELIKMGFKMVPFQIRPKFH